MKFLRGRQDIDPNRVGLWGISQGGWICPLAATLSGDIHDEGNQKCSYRLDNR